MDNTELHYLSYDSEAIWTAMMEAYQEAGGDILYPGDEKDMLLHGVLNMFVVAFAGVDNALRMASLRYAVGEYLDVYGEKRNCPRKKAKAATCATVAITLSDGNARTIPAGTALTADGILTWLIDDDLIWDGYATTLYTSITCAATGAAGNQLASGEHMQTLSAYADILDIVTMADASGGSDEEDDETYRERIRLLAENQLSGGTAAWYKNLAMSASGNVMDAVAMNTATLAKALQVPVDALMSPARAQALEAIMGESGSTVFVFIAPKDTDEAEAALADVEAVLDDDAKRQLTDKVKVVEAYKLTINLPVTVYCDGTATRMTAIQEAVQLYEEWQNGTIGQAINGNRLIAEIYSAGATRAVISAYQYSEVLVNVYPDVHVSITWA